MASVSAGEALSSFIENRRVGNTDDNAIMICVMKAGSAILKERERAESVVCYNFAGFYGGDRNRICLTVMIDGQWKYMPVSTSEVADVLVNEGVLNYRVVKNEDSEYTRSSYSSCAA